MVTASRDLDLGGFGSLEQAAEMVFVWVEE
jgi:hypothetical protein